MDSPVAGYDFFQGSDISSLIASAPNQDLDAVKASMSNQETEGNMGTQVDLSPPAFTPNTENGPIDQAPPGSSPTPPQSLGTGMQEPADNVPHPLLSDPRFASIYQNDTSPNKTAARQLYGRITGRDLKADTDLQAANAKIQTQKGESAVTDLVEKQGLRFDPITGEPRVSIKPENFANYQSADASTGTAALREVNPTQFAMLQKFYKPTYGQDLPQGIDVPRGLTPEEAVGFRQKVSDLVAKDDSKTDQATKIKNAVQKAHSEGWNAQQTAAAVASNPAVANAPGFLARNIARLGNQAGSIYNAYRNPIMNAAVNTFGDNPTMRSFAGFFPPISQRSPQDVDTMAASLTSGPRSLQEAWANLPP